MIDFTSIAPVHWREPVWLLLASQPLLLWILRSFRGHRRQMHYADPALLPWVVQRTHPSARARLFSRDSIYVLAWLLLAIAAAGPRQPIEVIGEAQQPASEVILLVDLSRSMTAADVVPNRKRRAQIELQELRIRSHDVRIGIIVYAAHPHWLVPPTADYAVLGFYLDLLDQLVLPTSGSGAVAALDFAGQESMGGSASTAVVWVTDGDFGDEDAPQRRQLEEAVTRLHARNIRLYILGVGSIEGAAVPLPNGGWLTHANLPVISRVDTATLAHLAHLGGGEFSMVRSDDGDWRVLYDRGIAARLVVRAGDSTSILWRELYAFALLPGLLLLFVALLPYRLSSAAAVTFTIAAPLLWVPLPGQAQGISESQAYRALINGDYAAAARLYSQIGGYRGLFGDAISRYRLADFSGAARQFGTAVMAAPSDAERAVALHNLGNSQFQLGDYASAVQSYTDALRYAPGYAPTQHNLELSAALQTAVEARLANAIAARAGRGPRSGRLAEGAAPDDNGSMSVDDAMAVTQAPPPNERAGLPESLILRGIEQVKLITQNQSNKPASVRRQQALATARLRMESLVDSQFLLWNRLFEIEEDFSAPLPEPRALDGVAPW